ncbi:hypothetical protein GCM10009582_01800 [Arthrobacter flavus]
MARRDLSRYRLTQFVETDPVDRCQGHTRRMLTNDVGHHDPRRLSQRTHQPMGRSHAFSLPWHQKLGEAHSIAHHSTPFVPMNQQLPLGRSARQTSQQGIFGKGGQPHSAVVLDCPGTYLAVLGVRGLKDQPTTIFGPRPMNL